MKNVRSMFGVILPMTIFMLMPVFVTAQEREPEQPIQPIQPPVQQPVPPSDQRPVQPLEQRPVQSPERSIQPMPLPPRDEFENEDDKERQDYVDPREIKDVLRQISQQKNEIKRLVKSAQKQKMSGAATELQSILSQITQQEQAIRSEGNMLTRDTLQEFYDAQIWESIEKIRHQVQLPQELNQIEKELKRVDSILKQKATAAIPNLDLEVIRAKVAEARAALEQAKSALASGDTDSVKEAMEVFWQEGAHPGEISGTLSQLREVASGLKRIKSAEVREAILDILSPVFESINDGDFREARMQLENLKMELLPLMRKAERLKTVDDNLQKKIQQLEQKLEDRSSDNQKVGGPQSYVPYWYNQRASVLDAIRSWFGF